MSPGAGGGSSFAEVSLQPSAIHCTKPHKFCHLSALWLFTLDIPLERALGLFFLKQRLDKALVHAQQYPLEIGFQCVIAAEKLSLSLGKPASAVAVGLPGCPDRNVQWHLHTPALTFT